MKLSTFVFMLLAAGCVISVLQRFYPEGRNPSRPNPHYQAAITEGARVLRRLQEEGSTNGIATVGQKQGRESLSLVVSLAKWKSLSDQEQKGLAAFMQNRADGLAWRIFKGGQIAAEGLRTN